MTIYIYRKKSHRRYGSEVATVAEGIHTTLTPAREYDGRVGRGGWTGGKGGWRQP